MSESQLSQLMYLQSGGPFARALMEKRRTGELESTYVYREYPKMLRISRGIERIERETETIKGQTVKWVEEKETFDDIIVHSEDEEERVLSGGKTSAQIEQERQDMIVRARSIGINVDPSWSAVRLRRELGEKLNAPEPVDEMSKLQEKLAQLQEMAAMKEKIAALEAQLAGKSAEATPAVDEVEELRAVLKSRGIQVDGRWSVARLRDEVAKL